MAFPVKVCSICSEEFELRPGKPGYANHCPSCSASERESSTINDEAVQRNTDRDLNAARKKAMRDLLYRKDS